eukprot:TRINITY_DN18429_c0_g1_i4.p3 TRINITY_DN18429_c0_g1~~TRINITY_DN18429_c0_g1_i4.p3  ORF type:complete len:193 (-),score=37.02 TRINITY_DN18429_c0_g1_i4:313-891(-)
MDRFLFFEVRMVGQDALSKGGKASGYCSFQKLGFKMGFMYSGFVVGLISVRLGDGLRAVKNALQDENLIPGAGAFEVAAAHHLRTNTKKQLEGRAKLGVDIFAEALLGIPKTLAENSGFDAQESIISIQEESENGNVVGLDISTGEPFDPVMAGVYDNYVVKKQMIQSAPIIASQLLLVDEVMRAGVNVRKK